MNANSIINLLEEQDDVNIDRANKWEFGLMTRKTGHIYSKRWKILRLALILDLE